MHLLQPDAAIYVAKFWDKCNCRRHTFLMVYVCHSESNLSCFLYSRCHHNHHLLLFISSDSKVHLFQWWLQGIDESTGCRWQRKYLYEGRDPTKQRLLWVGIPIAIDVVDVITIYISLNPHCSQNRDLISKTAAFWSLVFSLSEFLQTLICLSCSGLNLIPNTSKPFCDWDSLRHVWGNASMLWSFVL